MKEKMNFGNYKMKKEMRRIRAEPLRAKHNKIEKYRKKNDHYSRTQFYPRMEDHTRNPPEMTIPNKLQKYENISVFRDKDQLPDKQAPIGPFICDHDKIGPE